MLVCSGMFGCISGPVTTARCRAERAEHRCRERASNSHRSRVFVQDRMVGVGDRQAPGGVDTPDDSGAGLTTSASQGTTTWTPRMIRGQVSDRVPRGSANVGELRHDLPVGLPPTPAPPSGALPSPARLSVTMGNGTLKMYRHYELRVRWGMGTYSADPYTTWQHRNQRAPHTTTPPQELVKLCV